LDFDAVSGGEWGRSRDGFIGGTHLVRGRSSFGVNVEHPIATKVIRGQGQGHVRLSFKNDDFQPIKKIPTVSDTTPKNITMNGDSRCRS